ncbi:hypothetical protein IFO70_37030 [Phormidium tenue FACHB-886]|nr:hypothetical protein [Phormidium tenue FACHB-886]
MRIKSRNFYQRKIRILEIHILDNDGYRDTHTTIGDRTWWIPYITRFPTQILIVLESWMNRQSTEQVRQQIEAVQSQFFVGVRQSSQLGIPGSNRSALLSEQAGLSPRSPQFQAA